MSPLFSIIMPCCEVAEFVRESLNSVIKQSFRDWECLAVIEESKDGTAEIVREIAAADSRIKVFSGPRSGSPATPRNVGIDHAVGEYLLFFDSDDYIFDGALQRLADAIRTAPGADLYPFAMHEYNMATGENRTGDNYPADAPAELSGVEAIRLLDRCWLNPNPMAQLAAYRREFLQQHRLRFVDGLKHEDVEFSPRVLYRAQRVHPLHDVLYFYRYRRSGAITTVEHAIGGNELGHYARAYASLLSFYAEVSAAPDFDRQVASCWAREWGSRIFILWFSRNFVAAAPRKTRRETLAVLFDGRFDLFRSLLRERSLPFRIAGWWAMTFVRHPSLSWAAEQFFLRILFPLTERRNNR